MRYNVLDAKARHNLHLLSDYMNFPLFFCFGGKYHFCWSKIGITSCTYSINNFNLNVFYALQTCFVYARQHFSRDFQIQQKENSSSFFENIHLVNYSFLKADNPLISVFYVLESYFPRGKTFHSLNFPSLIFDVQLKSPENPEMLMTNSKHFKHFIKQCMKIESFHFLL